MQSLSQYSALTSVAWLMWTCSGGVSTMVSRVLALILATGMVKTSSQETRHNTECDTARRGKPTNSHAYVLVRRWNQKSDYNTQKTNRFLVNISLWHFIFYIHAPHPVVVILWTSCGLFYCLLHRCGQQERRGKLAVLLCLQSRIILEDLYTVCWHRDTGLKTATFCLISFQTTKHPWTGMWWNPDLHRAGKWKPVQRDITCVELPQD